MATLPWERGQDRSLFQILKGVFCSVEYFLSGTAFFPFNSKSGRIFPVQTNSIPIVWNFFVVKTFIFISIIVPKTRFITLFDDTWPSLGCITMYFNLSPVSPHPAIPDIPAGRDEYCAAFFWTLLYRFPDRRRWVLIRRVDLFRFCLSQFYPPADQCPHR